MYTIFYFVILAVLIIAHFVADNYGFDSISALSVLFAILWGFWGVLLFMIPSIRPIAGFVHVLIVVVCIGTGLYAFVRHNAQGSSHNKEERENPKKALAAVKECEVRGHQWNGHDCTRCGTRRAAHHLTGCTCIWCGEKVHNWTEVSSSYQDRKGGDSLRTEYVCSRCGETRSDSIWFPHG